MKRKVAAAFVISALGTIAAAPAYAGFYFGDETKGVTISNNESDLNIRIRLQPRFDFGDIVKSKDGKSYEGDKDLYLRRIRLELSGSVLTKTLLYNLTLTGDKWDKAGNTNEIGIQSAYLKWLADDALVFTAGKEKLPYSRVSLTSSSKQLLIERPVSTEAAKKVFGKTDAYYQPKISVGGKFLEGVVGYEAAIADGWQNGDTSVSSGKNVLKSDPLLAARVELSPKGWTEKSKSDAPLGKGQHLTLGLNYVNQGGIEYSNTTGEEDRSLWGFDISGHYEGLTAQFEYNEWEIDSTDSAVNKQPKGWYAQAGYFIDGPNIEPVVRYEVYDQDSNAANKEERIRTVGVNWYGKGHSMKVGANWVHHEYDDSATGKLANDDSKDIYQVQAQLYF